MTVACRRWLLCIIDFFCGLDVRVGLNLAVCFTSFLLDALKFLLPRVPHCHKVLLQPGGALVLVFSQFKTILRLVKSSFLEVSADGGVPRY